MRAPLAIAAALAAGAAVAVAGCGAGTPVAQRRAVAGFHSLEVFGGVTVRVVRAPAPSVTVHAGDAVVHRVVTYVSNDVLHVGIRDRGIVIGADPLRHVSVRVAMPALRHVQVDGSGDLSLGGMTAGSLTFRVRGAGDITARGRVRRLTVDIAGAGDARLARLQARTAHVLVHGAGDVALAVSDALDVEIRGAGEVGYRGDPYVTKSIRGPGDVRRVGP